jgi:hypothetical protein
MGAKSIVRYFGHPIFPRPNGARDFRPPLRNLLLLSKSIQGCLHNLQGGIHRCVLIARNFIWQEVSNPYHARGASVLGKDLK